MVFDGRDVHVASATPTGQVLVAGVLVGPAWTRAPIPCEIRFGNASLFLRAIPRPKDDDEATMHDGGALWHAAQRAVHDAASRGASSPPQEERTQIQAFPPVRPAAGQAPPQPGTALMPAARLPSSPPGPVDFSKTTPLANPQELQMAVAAARAAAPPPTFESSPNTVRAPLTAPAVPPAPPHSDGLLEPTVVGPAPAGFRVPSAPPPNAPPGQPSTTPPAAAPPAAPPPGAPAKPAKPSYWQEASPVKKATLILMPFALVLSYFMLLPDAPPPRPTAASTAQKRGAAARDAGAQARADAATAAPIPPLLTADAGPLATAASGDDDDDDESAATPAATGKPLPPRTPDAGAGKGASKKTPERAALDAVAEGALDEALRDYTALAALHPDDPNLREAVRMLRLKTGHAE
jgi:hypothetical protein